MAGRGRTCDAPRFRRPLYRAELQPHGMGEAGFEPATSCVLDKRSVQTELLARVFEVPCVLKCRVVQFRDKGSNLGLHVQSVVSCRLDDPGMAFLGYGTFGPSRTMLSKPLACPSTLDRAERVLRGGDLEPGAFATSRNFAGKNSGLFSS